MDNKQYTKFRKAGWKASDALKAAKVVRRFERLSDLGLVRINIEPDQEFDDSFVDTWTNVSEGRRKRIKENLWAEIDRDGVWGMVGEYNMFGQWVPTDSCWGFIGTDLENNEYRIDIMDNTIKSFRKYIQTRCRHCMGTGVGKKPNE